jgi:hypothetical protein
LFRTESIRKKTINDRLEGAVEKVFDSLAKFFEVVPFLAVAGVLAFLHGAVGGFSFGDYSVPAIGAPYRIVLIVGGVVLVALEILRRKAKATLPKPDMVKITIEHPGNGDLLTRTTVRGKFKKIPDGYKLRLLSGWEGGGFLPASDAVAVDQKSKTWVVKDTDVGGAPGQKRYLKICLVGRDSGAFFYL